MGASGTTHDCTIDGPDEDEQAVECEADDHELDATVKGGPLGHQGARACCVDRPVVRVPHEEFGREQEVDAHCGCAVARV